VSHYYLSNASLDTPLKELLRVQAQRFFIEHRFREAKSECGMADYQVRRWDAWHHHMALVMLGTLFLIKQKIAGRQQWPMLSFNDSITALAHLLPRRQLTAKDLAGIINKRHRLRQQAKDSHPRCSQVAHGSFLVYLSLFESHVILDGLHATDAACHRNRFVNIAGIHEAA
jgi:hypothetical protein